MARIRSVHPKLCESEDMVDVPAEVERTFVRLWTHCDDDGRAKDNPRLIKAALYPLLDDMTPDVVDEHLEELAKRDLIVRYEVDGVRYLSIPSWDKWQHPQKKRDSEFPPPPDSSTEPFLSESRSPTGEVSPVVVVGEGTGEVVGEGADADASCACSPLDGFDAFWNAYPKRNDKRIGRSECETKWKSMGPKDRADALLGASHYAEACADDLTLAKDPIRFLKGRVWVDWQDGPGKRDHRNGRDKSTQQADAISELHAELAAKGSQ